MRRTLLVGLGAATVLLAACSSGEPNYAAAAARLIEGDVGESLGLGELTADCPEPASSDVGSTFSCTATTPENETISFNAEVQADETVYVYATSYDKVAARVIERDLGQRLGLGALTASCEEPTSESQGAEFGCTATTPNGATITIQAQVQERGEVNVQTTNVLTVENLGTIESEAARILSEQVGETLPAENIDCGDQPVVAEAGEAFVCALTDPANGDVYDASITLDDLTNPTQLDVEVAAAPRP